MKKIAIIGANEFQNKLVLKAKELGIETHVFAWEDGAVAKENSDFFYPISITEKEKILEICKKIKIDGVCSISSDLAMPTVNFIAKELDLIGNSLECTKLTTNKYAMRNQLSKNNLPCPKYFLINSDFNIDNLKDLDYPLIVKPTDRSGSRGIYKVNNKEELKNGIKNSLKESFSREVIVEEFIEGNEYSVEAISQNGKHKIIQITKKFTTGSPHFIETGHIQPACLSKEITEKIYNIIIKSLDVLKVSNGASHSEIKILNDEVKIIEIGARMGGDFIGSDLVNISTGVDFLKLVLDISLGEEILKNFPIIENKNIAFVKFIFTKEDLEKFEKIKSKYEKNILEFSFEKNLKDVTDSSTRNGYYLMKIENTNILEKIKGEVL